MSAPYAGAPVTHTFRERWLSGNHVGAATPTGIVEVRRGRLNRRFHPYSEFSYPPFGDYPGALSMGFWYPDWQVNSDWETLDGVLSIRLEQSFDGNGVTSLTIQMDNTIMAERTGHAGALYHVIETGYYSPLRGYVPPGRPNPGVYRTAFFDLLPNAQIRVRQGYGSDQLVTTFLGLVDEIDTDSVPNQITLTGRDHGGVLVDQHFFGWAKEMALTSPLTFVPRSQAEKRTIVGGDAQATSAASGYPASAALDRAVGWRSAVQDGPNDVQWIQIQLPAGKYSQVYWGPEADNMHAYFGLKATAYVDGNGHHQQPSFNGVTIPNGSFYNPNGHTVPGDDWPYFMEVKATRSGGAYLSLHGEMAVGDGTILRIGFRKLEKVIGGYQAGLRRLGGQRREFTRATILGQWIVIDDLSDMVRCCLRWAGFKSWEVEDAGANLNTVFHADPSMTFIDLITTVRDQVGFTFFIGEPRDDSDDQDLGYPIFRSNRVLENRTGKTEFIDDTLLLTDAKVKISNADDRCIIRTRGISRDDGISIDGDTNKRLMFAYIPPWAGQQAAKVAGVIKQVTHTDEKLTTMADVQYACYLIALQIALLKYTAIIDLPANPGIGLDTLQSVIDRTQGLNSRLYVTNRMQEMVFGQNGHWTMELGGSLVDTPEALGVLADYKAAMKILDRGGVNPWLRSRDYGYQAK